jgi:uncharacterized protein (DUF1501 family)
MKTPILTRRHFVSGLGAAGLASTLPGFRFAYASEATDSRLLLIILRGAMDGLAAVVPYSDPHYKEARGYLAMPEANLIQLDNRFALHSSLKPFHAMYQSGELLVAHAIATPYRSRSHFDAQDLMENGSEKPHGLSTGWLNRAIGLMESGTTRGLALGEEVPLVLRGENPVTSWAPAALPEPSEEFMMRVQRMYDNDPQLNAVLLESQALKSAGMQERKQQNRKALTTLMQSAANFMNKPDGPRIGVVNVSGWDTHANQGLETGQLATQLAQLAEAVEMYRATMGPVWKQTAVLIITEFGRTVAANGTRGSDHGTGTAAFLAGGAVQGGRVMGDWPGLDKNKLYEERDLYPTHDLRSLCMGALEAQFAIPEDALRREVFPNCQAPLWREIIA